ncbi:2-phosphosulfolactate phosphatase [Neobacillus vireti]|uniref:Probable 2-phosphosulfolactate phosphatase n=1 Tax=Neobacillus vireti LMG 21834 TaxID=1131730 RepID=A0AB94IUZ0_9BACI|nr:2-phosphosulfolactate phosphatase [Neobacillus vireti]ETI70798.1 lipoprotein [Neobacillus vireti LMG 21834]KLT17661.1 2-phosphosulfolactate phosphatase [Neobacillus vireti]
MFDQSPYVCRVEWGIRGAREAAERGDIIIIVDVLSFSSTVISALSCGAIIYPYPPNLDGSVYAGKVDAEYILGRAEAARKGKPTLSPVSFNHEHVNKKYVLSSLNGAFCTWIASKVPALLIGALLNVDAVASIANQVRSKTKASITVVPCGEQWSELSEYENNLRPAIEDYLGAGAILSNLEGKKSPEAKVCIGAFQNSNQNIAELIWECGSGRELRERGFEADVTHCSRLNLNQTVPILHKDHFVPALLIE